jgi:hypothetical protein
MDEGERLERQFDAAMIDIYQAQHRRVAVGKARPSGRLSRQRFEATDRADRGAPTGGVGPGVNVGVGMGEGADDGLTVGLALTATAGEAALPGGVVA